MNAYRLPTRRSRRGALLPLIAVAIVILFVAAVFAIDLARIHVTRSELRTATDAAARAAVEALGRTDSEAEAIDAAMLVARANIVAGKPLQLDPDNIVFGSAQQGSDGTFSFQNRGSLLSSGETIFNSVRVTGERIEGSPDGPVNMLFGRLFGQTNFQPVQSATATRLDRDIGLVLDKSGSMSIGGRFEALLNGVEVFVDELEDTLPKENVSLVAYDTDPKKLVDLTDDLDSLNDAISEESPGGRTGIGKAMEVAMKSLKQDKKARKLALKSMVVMTDGRHNEGISPLTIARRAQKEGMTVHTITFSRGANQRLMREVALATGGTHLHATTDEQLVEAFAIIARQLQVLLIE